ncbi:DUF6702 family protein [Shewanella sp. 125m-7]
MMRFLLIFCSLLLTSNVQAHQQKTAVTSLSFNHRLQHIEVMHKFYLHDAEHAVKALFDPSADILSDKATQQTFADYVQSQFGLKSGDGTDIALSFVGVELDGKFLWVYQETKIPAEINVLSISNGALHELWPAQVNLVNVEGKGEVKSVLFDSATSWVSVALTQK